MKPRLALVVLIAALALTPSAAAHAVPLSSDPGAGARLAAAPAEVMIVFSEKVDPAATRLAIIDEAEQETPLENVRVSEDRLTVHADVPIELPPGGYLLRWEVLSTTDGHKTFGSIPFGVGQNATISGEGAADQGVRIDAVVGKLLMYVGLALMAGTFAFWYLILPRGQRKGHEEPMERLGTVAGWMHIVGVVLFGFSQWQLSDLGFSDYFFGTAFGQGIGQRFALGFAVLFGLVYALRRENVPAWSWGLTAFALFLLFIVHGSFSHTAGFVRPEWVGIMADTLHLVAISIWTGGLVAFVLFLHNLPRESDDLAEHLRQVPLRFSNTAFGSVIVAALTGLFMLWAIAGFDLGMWIGSLYGGALAAKIGLAVVMIGMGAWNKFRYVLRYARRGGIQTVRMFRNNVQREVYVAAVVFLLAAVVTNTSPPIYGVGGAVDGDDGFDVPDAGEDRLTLEASSATYDWTVQFHPPPALNEPTHFIVELFVPDAQTRDTNASRVWIDIEHTDRDDLGKTVVETNRTASGTYDAYGAYFSFAGNYNVTVHARSNAYNVFHEQVVFTFDLEADEA